MVARAKETFTESSDLDLGIKASSAVEPVFLWKIKNEIAVRLRVDVDIVDMSRADTVLLMQIVSTGKRIFTMDKSRSEAFDSLVFSQYLKLNEDRAEILEAIGKSGKIYG